MENLERKTTDAVNGGSSAASQKEVRVFENAQFGQVRTAQGASGEPLFCLTDVCKALELSNPSETKKRLQGGGYKYY